MNLSDLPPEEESGALSQQTFMLTHHQVKTGHGVFQQSLLRTPRAESQLNRLQHHPDLTIFSDMQLLSSQYSQRAKRYAKMRVSNPDRLKFNQWLDKIALSLYAPSQAHLVTTKLALID